MSSNISESSYTLPDGLEVYTKTYHPPHTIPPIAHVVFVHGFSDHINTYQTLPPILASRGIIFTGYDQRGFGRTSPLKPSWGNTGPSEKILSDLDCIISARIAAHGDLPCFLIGHSMGGGIALTYGYQGTHRNRLQGVIAWAPWLLLAQDTRPSGLTVAVGKLGAKIWPEKQLYSGVDAGVMSRDERVCREYKDDPLCHDYGTLQCLAGNLERGQALLKKEVLGAFSRGLRVLVLHGTGDRVTDHEASRRFVEEVEVEDKEFRSYKGFYHKMHEEPGEDKVRFANDIADWILKRVPGADSESVASAKL